LVIFRGFQNQSLESFFYEKLAIRSWQNETKKGKVVVLVRIMERIKFRISSLFKAIHNLGDQRNFFEKNLVIEFLFEEIFHQVVLEFFIESDLNQNLSN